MGAGGGRDSHFTGWVLGQFCSEMDAWPVSVLENGEGRRRSQYVRLTTLRSRHRLPVTCVRPRLQVVIRDESSPFIDDDECPLWHARPRDLVDAFRATIEPLIVKSTIHGVGGGPLAERAFPCITPRFVIASAAQGAGAMTGRQRDRFVEEEQWRPSTRLPLRSDPSFVLERARDPSPDLPRTNDRVAAMDASAVPHEHPALVDRDDVSERGDSILLGHALHRAPLRAEMHLEPLIPRLLP
jgi:hypothetical protein